MIKYRAKITCPDCTYTDSKGCNEGEPWYSEWYDCSADAVEAGSEMCEDSIYKFEIEEALILGNFLKTIYNEHSRT